MTYGFFIHLVDPISSGMERAPWFGAGDAVVVGLLLGQPPGAVHESAVGAVSRAAMRGAGPARIARIGNADLGYRVSFFGFRSRVSICVLV